MKPSSKFFLIFLVILLLIVPLTVAEKPSELNPSSIIKIGDNYEKGEYIISISEDGELKLKEPEIKWVEEDNKFWVEYSDGLEYNKDGTLKNPLTEVHFIIEPGLITNYQVTTNNQFYKEATWDEVIFDTFIAKNNITSEERTPILSKDKGLEGWWDCVKDNNFILIPKIVGCMNDVVGYKVSFYGTIYDLDPEISAQFSAVSEGWFNETEASANGVGLIDGGASYSSESGDYRSLVFYNNESTLWNITLGVNERDAASALSNSGNGTNVTLFVRHADEYNITDPNFQDLFSFNNDNATSSIAHINAENGVIIGTVVNNESNGYVGKGIYKATDSDFIRFNATDFNFVNDSEGTVSAWIRPDDISAGGAVMSLVSPGGPGIGMQYVPFYQSAGSLWTAYFENTGWKLQVKTTANVFTANDIWYHVVTTSNGTAIKIYVNGVDQALTIWPGAGSNTGQWFDETFNTNRFTIGTLDRYAGPIIGFEGGIDDIRIYNRSLSATEIHLLYNMSSYHIAWDGGDDNWVEEGKVENEIITTTTSSSNFTQYKAELFTNNTNFSPFLTNYTVIPAGAEVVDTIYPIFSNYIDNNNTFQDILRRINVTVTNTNDNVGLEFNGVNYTASNIGSVFNSTFTFGANGTFSYYWWGEGDGPDNNYNISNIQYYTVKELLNTSMLGVKFNLSDFTFNSPTYIRDGSFSYNTSFNDQNLVLVSTMNVQNLGIGTGSIGVYLNITGDADEQLWEGKISTITWSSGDTVIRSTGTIPLNITNPSSGSHNISFWFKRDGSNRAALISNIDLSLGKLESNTGGVVNFTLEDISGSTDSTDLVTIQNFSIFKNERNTSDYHITSLTMTASAETIATCRFSHDDESSPYIVRHIADASDSASAGIPFLTGQEGNHNVTLQCSSSTGATLTATGRYLEFTLLDNNTATVNGFDTSNVLTNTTDTVTYSAGLNIIANATDIEIYDDGDSYFMGATVSFNSSTQPATPTIIMNSTINGGTCTTQKQRSINSDDDIANVFIYYICKDNPLRGEFHNFTLWMDVPAGETITVFDEGLSGFEVNSFNTVDLNTAPVVDIFHPEVDQWMNGTRIINFTVTDFQGDTFAINVTAFDGVTLTDIALNQDVSVRNVSWDTTLLAEGYYNITVNVFENDTSELFQSNDTHQVQVNNYPPDLNITFPLNITYSRLIQDINYTIGGGFLSSCTFDVDEATPLPVTCGVNVTGLSLEDGTHNITVTATDEEGRVNVSEVFFVQDTTGPNLTVFQPENITYEDTTVFLNVSAVDELHDVQAYWYSLDGAANVTFTPNISIATIGYETFHDIIFYVNDTLGNTAVEHRRFFVGNIPDFVAIGKGLGCGWKKFGYYNLRLPWFREVNCI